MQTCADTTIADAKWLKDKIKARLEWSDLTLLRAVLTFINTQTWSALPSEENEDLGLVGFTEAVELITSEFGEPLEAKQVDLTGIQDEVEEIVPYARKYLNISTEGYRKVWYKLHTCPNAGKSPNLLRVSELELVFSLPFSNAHVGQLFSTLTNRRTYLDSSTLSDLLEIQVEGPPPNGFRADDAIALWWKDCNRINQQPQKDYRSRESGSSSTDTTKPPETTFIFDEWFVSPTIRLWL